MAIVDINGSVIQGGGESSPTLFRDKLYVAAGDSIVDIQSRNEEIKTYTGVDLQGVQHTDEPVRGYIQDIQDHFGMRCEKWGDSGGTIIRNYPKLLARDYSKASLFTIAFGTNDARTGVQLGEVGSTNHETYAGALRNILRKVYTDNPNCKCIVLAPPQRLFVHEIGSYTPNPNGKTLEDFANMAVAVAKYCGAKAADIFHDSGLNQQTLFYMSREGVHPLNNGYKLYSNVLIPIINDMCSVDSDTEFNGKLKFPTEPTSEDSPITDVPLTADLFTTNGIYWNGTDGISNAGNCKQVGKGIALEPGKTYFLTVYNNWSDLSNRMYAISDSATQVTGSNCWGKMAPERGISEMEEVQANGRTYYKWTHVLAVPNAGQYYLWPSYWNELGVESVSIKYF